jgi:DUF177 domain-containing protein
MEGATIDLDQLGLRSGQGETIEARVEPDAPVVGGVELSLEDNWVDARLEVSRTSSGFALKLVADVVVLGSCMRCLEPATLQISIASREVDHPGADDSELMSPYVDDGLLDLGGWVHDAITLALPEQLLCRPDCAGICPECGINLNQVGPEGHSHEPALDPRFAKLRELLE